MKKNHIKKDTKKNDAILKHILKIANTINIDDLLKNDLFKEESSKKKISKTSKGKLYKSSSKNKGKTLKVKK